MESMWINNSFVPESFVPHSNEIEISNDCHESNSNQMSSSTINDNETFGDLGFPNDNLSWLLNFKLDNLISTPILNGEPDVPKLKKETTTQPKVVSNDIDFAKGSVSRSDSVDSQVTSSNGPIVFETVEKKPPFTYTELIEHALQEKGELTVSGIYQWISDHFPYYKTNDDRWKNSVRHNLSINPHFRKGGKALHGAGHLWTIAHTDDLKSQNWLIKNQRLQQFIALTKQKIDEQALHGQVSIRGRRSQKTQESQDKAGTTGLTSNDSSNNTAEVLQFVTDNSSTTQAMAEINSNISIHETVQMENSTNHATEQKLEVQYVIPVPGSLASFVYPIEQTEIIGEYEVHTINNSELQEMANMSTTDGTSTFDEIPASSTVEDYFVADNGQSINFNTLDYTSYQQLFYSDEFNLQYSELLT